jgi:hypothetical protein
MPSRASTTPLATRLASAPTSSHRMRGDAVSRVAGASSPAGALGVSVSRRDAVRPDVSTHARISSDDKCV